MNTSEHVNQYLTLRLRGLADTLVNNPEAWVVYNRGSTLTFHAPFIDFIGPDETGYSYEYFYQMDLERLTSKHGDLYVGASIRGAGIARRLIEIREQMACELGIKEIIIDNCTSPEFWKHMGYKRSVRNLFKKHPFAPRKVLR